MPSSKCDLFWFFSIQLLKKHTLNPEITLLYQFHAQKALFKVTKICTVNFWRQLWDNFATNLKRLWDNFETNQRQPCDNYETTLGQHLDNFETELASYSLPHPQACLATGLVRSALNIIRIRIDYKEEKRVRETRELDNNLPRLLLVMSRHCLHGNVHNRLQPQDWKSILRHNIVLCRQKRGTS